jgi:type I restriction enzyme M protein
MTEDQKKLLETQLWNIANTLRGKMHADEFRDYILGFIFFKYLSERLHAYANGILQQDGIEFSTIDETSPAGQEILAAVREETLDALGYFLTPSELFTAIAKKGEQKGAFIIGDLKTILGNIERSTMGAESEGDFDHLFEDLDLDSTKLGRTVAARNEIIARVLTHLDAIDFGVDDVEADILGDGTVF